jgi:hypothetical protein
MWNIFVNLVYIVAGYTWAVLTGEVARLNKESQQ